MVVRLVGRSVGRSVGQSVSQSTVLALSLSGTHNQTLAVVKTVVGGRIGLVTGHSLCVANK